jgi:dTDP-4-amino-4,6-dideoxygalactose transaminase
MRHTAAGLEPCLELQGSWQELRRGIPPRAFPGGCSEIYLERAFAEEMRPSACLPVARELGETSLMFLVHPTLLDVHIEMTCNAVKRVVELATV